MVFSSVFVFSGHNLFLRRFFSSFFYCTFCCVCVRACVLLIWNFREKIRSRLLSCGSIAQITCLTAQHSLGSNYQRIGRISEWIFELLTLLSHWCTGLRNRKLAFPFVIGILTSGHFKNNFARNFQNCLVGVRNLQRAPVNKIDYQFGHTRLKFCNIQKTFHWK